MQNNDSIIIAIVLNRVFIFLKFRLFRFVFYQNAYFGKQCYEQYTKLCKQFESKEELDSFFDKYIHVVIMSPEYKTIIIRYSNI